MLKTTQMMVVEMAMVNMVVKTILLAKLELFHYSQKLMYEIPHSL